jgi:twinkle protein
MLTGDQPDRESNSARNAATPGATSGTGASPSPKPGKDGSGSATTAASAAAPEIHERHLAWIEQRGISAELAAKLGLETVTRNGANWLAVPYVSAGKTINHKYRLTREKRHQMDPGAPLALWNEDCLREQSDRPVVICEGEWDAMVALQLGWRAVSVPNGAPAEATEDVANAKRYEFLWRAQDLLNRVGKFIIATDDDAPGRALRTDLVALLGADRCFFVDYPFPSKDLNEVLLEHGPEAAATALNSAKPVPVRGLYKVSDFPEPGPISTIPIGIPGLDRHLHIVPGTLTVLTGWAGEGKTSLTMAMLGHLIRHNVPVTIGTFETAARPILQRKLRAAIMSCGEFTITPAEAREADALIHENVNVIAQMVGEDQEMDLEDVLDFARIAIQRDGSKLLLLDPWNEIEHKRRKDESETEYTGRAIRAIKHFARLHQIAVWIVAHPAKPADAKRGTPGLYSISGSAHWANKPDYGLVFTRDRETNIAKVHVTKVRMGMPGKEGVVALQFDHRTSTYSEMPA